MSILTAERLEEIRREANEGAYWCAAGAISELISHIAAHTPPAEGEVAQCIGYLRNATEWHAYTSWAATGGGGMSQECKSPFTAADLLTRLSAECERLKAEMAGLRGLLAETLLISSQRNERAEAAERERDEAMTALEDERAARFDLSLTAKMLRAQAAELWPEVNAQGQVHFGRAVMESAAEAIEAYMPALDSHATIKEPKP